MNVFTILDFFPRFQVFNFGIQSQVAGVSMSWPNKKSTTNFLLFLPTVFWLLNLVLSKISQKISKWWEMTRLLFVCYNSEYKCKWGSRSKWKYGGIYLKIKSDIWKIAKSFRSRHLMTDLKSSSNSNNQYQGRGGSRVWPVTWRRSLLRTKRM